MTPFASGPAHRIAERIMVGVGRDGTDDRGCQTQVTPERISHAMEGQTFAARPSRASSHSVASTTQSKRQFRKTCGFSKK